MEKQRVFHNKIARVYEKGKIDYIQEELCMPEKDEVLIGIRASLISASGYGRT